MDHFNFQPSPMVCSSNIEIDIEDGIIRKVKFTDGCHGNLQGVAKLAKNRPVEEVIALKSVPFHVTKSVNRCHSM